MTCRFCGKSWREKQRHKGAQEGGKAQPLVRRQDVGQTLPDRASCLLCLHPAPWPQPPPVFFSSKIL